MDTGKNQEVQEVPSPKGLGGASRLEDGGPAFPEVYTDWSVKGDGRELHDTYSAGGMSLRDYFAAKALQAILCQPDERRAVGTVEEIEAKVKLWRITDAVNAYEYADAMLKARKAGAA